jgi:hypothetical protein
LDVQFNLLGFLAIGEKANYWLVASEADLLSFLELLLDEFSLADLHFLFLY